MPDYDDDKYIDLSPQLQENDEYVDLSPQLKESDEYVNLSPFKKEGGASRPASDANQYQNLSPAREESDYQVLHVPRVDEPYQVLHVPREDEPYQVFDMKTNKMIELNKAQPDQMIELNKMREKYGVGEKAAEFAVNFQNSFFSALNKGQFFQNQNSESPEENKPFFVMNVPSPPPATAEEKYVFMQEAAELSSINVASFNKAANNISRVYQPGNTSSTPSFHVANKSSTQGNFQLETWKSCDESNLAHPPWYLGFWRDTSIRIRGEKLHRGADATINITFGYLERPKPSISHTSTTRTGGEELIRINIADYSSNHPGFSPLPGSPGSLNAIGGRKKDSQINDPTGWLIVWNADVWKCQLARDTINYHDYDFDGDYGWENHNYNYICPDLFDYITISIEQGNEFEVSSIRIVLNGVNILEKNYPATQPFTRPIVKPFQSFVLDNYIEQYKHNSLVCNQGAYSDDPKIGYDRSRILQNDILSLASKELGQSWSPKYAPEALWRKDRQGNWATAPDSWCADFAGWLIEQTNRPLSIDEVPFNLADFPDLFMRKSNYFCPSNTSYENLGNVVEPGFVVSMRQGGHTVIFLYWIEAGICNCWNLDSILSKEFLNQNDAFIIRETLREAKGALDHFYSYDNPNPIPGRFIPDAPVNWFAVINGNSGGGRVKNSLTPIINLKKRNRLEISYRVLLELFDNEGDASPVPAVLYSEVGDWERSGFPDSLVRYEDGFGDTNGFLSGFRIGSKATGFHRG